MRQSGCLSTMFLMVAVAIGCGGGAPEDAAATQEAGEPDAPMRLSQATGAAPPAGGAAIRGTIHFEGTAPAAEKVKMNADPVCLQQQTGDVSPEAVAVNENQTLQHVFVYVKEGLSGTFPAPGEPVTLDQSGCWYHPHVFGIQTGQPLQIVNSDATLHNVNAKPTTNQPFNIAQPVKGMKTSKTFSTPEVMVKFKCNVHPWMIAYAGVLDHPFFAVSGADGRFAIEGLPAGTYVLEAWHETYGTQTREVSVGEGEGVSTDFTFTGQ